MTALTASPAWQALGAHAAGFRDTHLRDLFAKDPKRFERFTLRFDDLLLDYSKNRIDDETMRLLLDLARAGEVEEWRDRMFAGETINTTENRAVLHVALRNRSEPADPGRRQGRHARRATRSSSRCGASPTRSAAARGRGYTGKTITDVVNIGIGGSDLGPLMVCEALKPYQRAGSAGRISSPTSTARTSPTRCRGSIRERTLFIVASKTFTTQETMTNAETPGAGCSKALGDDARGEAFRRRLDEREGGRRASASTPTNMFGFWDWVGGRYSLWSAIGLPICACRRA